MYTKSVCTFSEKSLANLRSYCLERIISTCAICLFNEFNVSMLTAVNLSVVKLMTETLSSKVEEDSVSFLH